jgi:hypothetical protein
MFSSLSYGHNTASPESAESAPSVDRTPRIRSDLVYLAEWMCKFNVVEMMLRQLSARANHIGEESPLWRSHDGCEI